MSFFRNECTRVHPPPAPISTGWHTAPGEKLMKGDESIDRRSRRFLSTPDFAVTPDFALTPEQRRASLEADFFDQ